MLTRMGTATGSFFLMSVGELEPITALEDNLGLIVVHHSNTQ